MNWPVLGAGHDRSLRLSVTDRCNLRCRYCMPEHREALARDHGLPSLERLTVVARWLVEHAGVHRIRLTGGEPLVRSDLPAMVAALNRMPGVEEISLTSNGALLEHLALPLRDAGLARVNVSLDTLDPHRFAVLTRGGRLADTVRGIHAALAAGLRPLKLNTVLRRSSWIEDLPTLIDFAAREGLELRLIELMETAADPTWTRSEQIPMQEVRTWLEQGATLMPLPTRHTAPARRHVLRWDDRELAIGFISPRSAPFCGHCNRLRVDMHGRLHRCLMDTAALPLLDLIEAGDDATTTRSVEAYLAGKSAPVAMASSRAMHAIGG
ncbi:MAG: GTP 3',8-cyclase MoaA [Pseudomonadota bacterium]